MTLIKLALAGFLCWILWSVVMGQGTMAEKAALITAITGLAAIIYNLL